MSDTWIRCEKRSLLEFKSHKIFWNRYLSWFYVQGKELGKPLFKKSHLQTCS
jgi:hypothetical protein